MHAHIHTYRDIHTYINNYIHIHTPIYTYRDIHTYTNTCQKPKAKAKSTAAALAVTPPGYKSQSFLCATQDLWACAGKSS